jgi:cytochrome c
LTISPPKGSVGQEAAENEENDHMMKSVLTASALIVGLALPAFAEGDAEAGEKVFKKCKACHQVGEGAKNRVGPILTGIVDGKAGAIDGFKYSKALQVASESGLIWTETELSAFLTKPKDYMKGTKMSFAGLRKEAEVAAVIAYLKSTTP